MNWRFQPSTESFEQLRCTWDDLNRAGSNHILLDSGFVSALLKYFGKGHVKLGIDDDPHSAGMALLTQPRPGFWETFQPSQAPIGLLVFREPDRSLEKLQRLMRKLPGFALELSILQQDLSYSSVPLEQSRPGIERLDYIQTASIPLTGTFEEYWKERGTKVRNNLSRRRRRMTEQGHVTRLVAVRAAHEVKDAIAAYGRLESNGWKGANGTALGEENAQGRFYCEVFEHFCARGEGVIYQFLVDDRVAASDLCLQRNGMFIVLKTAYDETLQEYSPALLMHEEILSGLYAEGNVRVVEFYGRVMDWHTRFTRDIRSLYHINCLRYPWLSSLKKIVRLFK